MSARDLAPRSIIRMAAGGAALVLAAAACSSGSTTQTAGGANGPAATSAPATATTAAPTPCDTSVNPVGFYEDAAVAGTLSGAGHGDHMDGHGDGHGSMDHGSMDHGSMDHGSAGSTKPMDMTGGLGEVEAAKFMQEMAKMDEAAYREWLESLNPNREAGAPDDTGMGGHLGPQTWVHMSDPAKCDQLRAELDQARATAERFPKASDAMAAGYVRVAPYLPGIASHWMNFSLIDGRFDVNAPEMLLYDGNDATSNLVGLSYFIRSDGGVEPTVGFTSDNDHYHRHEGLCIGAGGVIGDSTTSEEECRAIGGRKSRGADGWMSHAWVVPGCESPWGVFSAQNPLLDMPLVDGSGQGAPCSASEIKERWDLEPAPG